MTERLSDILADREARVGPQGLPAAGNDGDVLTRASGSVAWCRTPFRHLENSSSTSFSKWSAALARQDGGGALAKIAFIGDSTTAGALAGSGDATGYRPNGFVSQLATKMTAAGRKASAANAIGNARGVTGVGNPPGEWDSRLTSSGAWEATGNLMAGGDSLSSVGSAGTLTFAPGETCDTADLYYFDQTGVFTVNVDGGATLSTVTQGGTALPKKRTISFSPGTRAINVVWVSGNWNFLGFDAYLSTDPRIHLLNLGSGSATAQALAANANAYDPIPWYTFIAPDLTIISLGINDWLDQESVDDYSAGLQTIITACQVSGDVMLMTPFPSAISQASIETQATYVGAMRALALSNNIPLFDENFNLGSKAQMIAFGFGTDVNHPNQLGHGAIAADLLSALLKIM